MSLTSFNFHPTPEQLDQLERGIELGKGETTLPAKVKVLRENDKYSFLELVLVEGKNRQVRRMIEALGGRVMKLVRTALAALLSEICRSAVIAFSAPRSWRNC